MFYFDLNFFQEPLCKKRRGNNGGDVTLATSTSMEYSTNRSEGSGRYVSAKLIELEDAVKQLKVSMLTIVTEG